MVFLPPPGAEPSPLKQKHDKDMSKLQAYLAGPFFSEEQLAAMKRLELMMIGLGSAPPPSRSGNLVSISPRLERSAHAMNKMIAEGETPPASLRRKVYEENLEGIDNSNLVVAITDDFDPGTLFEIGYATARKIPIVTFSAKGYGSNLMLAQAAFIHVRSFEELSSALTDVLGWLRTKRDLQTEIALAHHRIEPLQEGPSDES